LKNIKIQRINNIVKHKESERYFKLKIEALAQANGNRARYTKLKEKYIETILKKIKN